MSDEKLLHELRNSKGWPTLGNAAADRIEQLEAEKKYCLDRTMEQDDRIEELEAKLAKAMEDKGVMHIHAEALAEIKATIEGKSDQPIADIIAGCIEEVAAYHATLAENKESAK